VTARLFDTHCHLQDAAFDGDRDDTLARALEALEGIVVVGDDLETSRRAVDLTRPRVYAAVGIHPYHADAVTPEALNRLRALAANPAVVAIGEAGMDYSRYSSVPGDVQERAFRAQLELAGECGLPVVVHNRDAHDDVSRVLDEMHGVPRGGIMHCFAGGAAFAERCVGWGFHVSFAGNVTYPKAHDLREAARAVPADRLLVETDAPYLAPQPRRGKRNEPAHVRFTAECIAGERGLPLDDLAAQTTRNARRLFGLV
jgi:TatD DNase family protein